MKKNGWRSKKFIPQLAIDAEFSIVHFLSILVCCKTKAQSEQCSPYCAFGHQVANGQLLYEMAGNLYRAFTRWGTGGFFLKKNTAPLSNEDLSNEPNFGQIHFAVQYL